MKRGKVILIALANPTRVYAAFPLSVDVVMLSHKKREAVLNSECRTTKGVTRNAAKKFFSTMIGRYRELNFSSLLLNTADDAVCVSACFLDKADLITARRSVSSAPIDQ